MGKIYKMKAKSGCALCKPHKHKWADKKKVKERDLITRTDKEMKEYKKNCF